MRILLLVLLTIACGGAPRPGFDGIAPAIERGEAPETTSVLIERGESIVYERYFNGATATTLHDTRSATKSLTALSVGIAIDRHVLPGVDAPAFASFADPGPGKAAITIADLLTMSSALDCDDNDDKSPGNEEHMYPQPSWTAWALAIPVRADYQRDATGRGPWHYCTAGVFLLGQILARAAKQPVDQFMARTCSRRSASRRGSSRARRPAR